MSGNNDVLALLDKGEDLLVVVGPDTLSGELERLTTGRGDVVASAPDVDLLLTPLLPGVVLVQAGELTVVTLVEGLVLVDGDVLLTDLLELDAKGGLSTLEGRGESDVELDAGGSHALGTGQGLLATELSKSRVLPTGEEVELVPFGLTVTSEDESSNHFEREISSRGM